MRKIYLTFFLISTFIASSQSLDETIQWIGMNSKGREYVQYDKKTDKLQFISKRTLPDDGRATLHIVEFNYKNVSTISLVPDDETWNIIVITFKSETNIKFLSGISVKNAKAVGDSKSSVHPITLKVDLEIAKKYQKAYLHLFKILGVTVKNGNYF